jgi:hypothetical protein
MRVFGRWNFRVAFEASWQSIYRFRKVWSASKTRSERILGGSPSRKNIGLKIPSFIRRAVFANRLGKLQLGLDETDLPELLK